jgi:hypothetical protein
MRNVLVISSSEWPVAALRAALGDDIDELRVVRARGASNSPAVAHERRR